MKRLIISLLVLSFVGPTIAQVNTYYLDDWLPASQWRYNPASQSKEKVYLYLPVLSGFNASVGHTGFSYNDAVSNGTVNLTDLINGLESQNHFLTGFNTDLAAVGLKFGNVQIRTGVSSHIESRFTYTKDLLELAWFGNGHPDIIGRRLSMDGTGMNSSAYLSYFLGGSASLLDNTLNVGVNVKFYNGVATAYTENSTFGLLTNDTNYNLTIDGSYDVRTSGAELTEGDVDPNIFLPLSVEGNKGVGVDVGLTFSPVEAFTIEASAMNLGSIKWTQDIKNYQLTDQEITYSGFELNEFISAPDSAESTLEQFTDSISDLFIPTENSNEFSTKVNGDIFLRGVFAINNETRVSAFFNSKNSFGTNLSSVGAMFSKDVGRTLRFNTGLQLFRMKDAIVPIGLVLNAGPVQLGLHTSNILSIIQPRKTKYVSGMFSIGFRFKKERDE